MAITINGYKYDKETRELLYSSRDSSYYCDSTDPLTQRLYEALDKESNKNESLFGTRSACFTLDDIFFICACLYEDNDPNIDIDKHIGTITDGEYPESPLDGLNAQYTCLVYGCVLGVLAVQKFLPNNVNVFMAEAQNRIAKSKWANNFKEARKITTNAVLGDNQRKQYETDLYPNVRLSVLHFHANKLDPITPSNIRMVLSRIRYKNDCSAAISIFYNVVCLSISADLSLNWRDFFAALHEELQKKGKIEREPTKEEVTEKETPANEKDAEIARLKEEVETLKTNKEAMEKNIKDKDAEIAHLKEEIEKLKKSTESKPTFEEVIPEYFRNKKMMIYWDGLRDADLLDGEYRLLTTKAAAKYIVECFCKKRDEGIRKKGKNEWEPFRKFWELSYLKEADETFAIDTMKKINEVFL